MTTLSRILNNRYADDALLTAECLRDRIVRAMGMLDGRTYRDGNETRLAGRLSRVNAIIDALHGELNIDTSEDDGEAYTEWLDEVRADARRWFNTSTQPAYSL